MPSVWISDLDVARDYGAFLLRLLKDQLTRVPLTFDASDDPDLSADLDLSDRVVVEIGGEEIDMFVESITHSHPRSGRHFITVVLSPASVYGTVIVLNRGPGLGTGILSS